MTVSFDNVGHAFEQTNASAGDHSWQAVAALDAYPIGKGNASNMALAAGEAGVINGASGTAPKSVTPEGHVVGSTKPAISVEHGVAIKDGPGTAGKAVAPEGRRVGSTKPEIPVVHGVAIKDGPGTAGKAVAPEGRHLGNTKPEISVPHGVAVKDGPGTAGKAVAPEGRPVGITKVESGGGQPPTAGKDGNGIVPKSAPDSHPTWT